MGQYVVTGAASGIGRAIKSALEAEGHMVVGVDLRDADMCADLSRKDEVEATIREIHARCPEGLNGFVPCAGAGVENPNKKLIPLVNYFAVVQMVEGLMPSLESRRGAAVLMCSNSATMQGHDEGYVQSLLDNDRDKALELAESLMGFQLYGGGKLALGRWMRKRSTSAAQAGVRLNALAPGFTHTAMTEAGMKDPVVGPSMKAFVKSIPLGRGAQPEDQANAALFLLSDKASQIAGSILFVDGGHDAMFRPDAF
ncbi:MAG: SDR family oxidoreductase [Gammaproteobacteria bacterium]|nr:SDR family oxidoreductase [Gammaproteobacteria bacterium]MCY4276884.1 SDR family oxidoreductase [Gammaproteobacteria bacterium]MCY4323289.1 SDR family oxidoreductase [Gammaproteobacteria bacterium]